LADFDYLDQIYIKAKLKEWEVYYNCHKPHVGLKGKPLLEVLREKLQSKPKKSKMVRQ
jgi:transposase InsO family protein